MTLGAFQPSDIFNLHRLLASLGMQLHQLVVIFVSFSINICIPVAIDTPPHGKVGILIDHIHFFYWSMAGLTLNFCYINVLGVVKIRQIREVMNSHPFDRLRVGAVGLCCRIIIDGRIIF